MNTETILKGLEQHLAIASLPEEMRRETVARLGAIILERTILHIVERLSEENAERVLAMQEEGALENVLTYLNTHYPTLEEEAAKIAQEVIAEFSAP